MAHQHAAKESAGVRWIDPAANPGKRDDEAQYILQTRWQALGLLRAGDFNE